MSGTWQAAPSGAQLPGEQYRVTMSIRAPYSIENIENLEAHWRQSSGLTGNIRTDNFTVHFPVNGVWKAVATYTVLDTPAVHSFGVVLDTIGNLCQDVVGFVINSTALILTTVEKFVVGTVAGVTAPITHAVDSVLNPGVLILVVVGIFLIVRR